ncbi:MAG: carbamoyltransferase family protein, partial [Saprospiraceae bacterium]
MIILGLNAYHADAAAALYVDGCLLVAAEEERFCRIKHRAGFPSEAVQFCLREAGIRLSQVDYIAVGRNQTAKLGQKVAFLLGHPRLGCLALQNIRQIHALEHDLARLHPGLPLSALRSKIHRIEHHRAHLASAFYASPFETSALLSLDGSGDFSTAMTGTGQHLDIHVHASVDYPHSAGLFYAAFTQFLGFPHYGDEYKLMGLAAYGRPTYLDALMRILQLKRNGLFALDRSWFRTISGNLLRYNRESIPVVAPLFADKMIRQFGAPRLPGEPLTEAHFDLAASVQHALEKVYFHVLAGIQRQTGLKSVCVAGGVSQNSVANGKITQQTNFNQVYIPPAGHDAGIALGAALYLQHQRLKMPRKESLATPFIGARFSNEQIEALLKARRLRFRKMEDTELLPLLAAKIAGGAVCGWFSGRSEFGPRALGGRSILADPRRADAKDLLNRKIKRREYFRPFAPAVLETHAVDYFELDGPSPFMEKVVPVRPEKRGIIPAVTHLDGSARVQTVCPKTAPRFHALIAAFHN